MSLFRPFLKIGTRNNSVRLLNDCTRKSVSSSRNYSSAASHVILNTNSETGLATLTMSSPPVNSMSQQFLAEFADGMRSLEADKSVKGIMITSAHHGKVFSAGFDILEMYNKNDESLRTFWSNVHEWYFSVFGCSKPVVAAINGHAPAGGCALSLMADYRVMCSGRTIGLNETALGIVAPFFFVDLMTRAIGQRHSELALLAATMFTSEQGHAINLVDEVVELESVQEAATKKLLQLSKVPQPAYYLTKTLIRGGSLQLLKDQRESDIQTFVNLIQQPIVQKTMGRYLDALKSKKKK